MRRLIQTLLFIFGYMRGERHLSQKGAGISILIPARCAANDRRLRNLNWIRRYWKVQLPGAEIIIGEDWRTDLPFSKAAAVNEAARHASGDIFVITDTDIYIDAKKVLYCAEEIRWARRREHRLWFVPYRQFYRLTEAASDRVLASSPYDPELFPTPPRDEDILDCSGSGDPHHGHWFGAGIQIVPREAFRCVGGWDQRFRGWGGEDFAIMRATDTLYWHHKTLPGQVLHLWHEMMGPLGMSKFLNWQFRMWAGQIATGINDKLSGRYWGANGHFKRMRRLVDEGLRK